LQGKKEFNQRIYYNINLDSLVPDDHFLKRLDSLVSFNFVRDITKDYYSHTGKPSIDPVVLVKMLLVGYLFDIRSERKLTEEISLNLAYRWYIGYDLDEEIPDHSIFSKARVRFGKKLFVEIFEKILARCMELGLVSKDGMLIDSTIVRANASDHSMVETRISPGQYWKRLEEDRPKKKLVGRRFGGKVDKDKMGKRTRDINRLSLRKKSTTDPDATIVHRPGMGSHLSYKAHVATDTGGIITAVSASPSVTHDTGAVPNMVESHERVLGTPSWIAADTKYGSEECLAYLQDRGIKTAIRPETKISRPGHFSKSKFKYDSSADCYICPNGKMLRRKSKNYPQNRINYKSSEKDCKLCPLREKCISGKDNFRIVSHYDSPCYFKARSWYDSGYGKAMQKLRHTVIEGVFGQAKTYHGMSKARFRGLNKVEIQFLLTATALNLKKMVKMMDVEEIKSSLSRKFTNICQITKGIIRNFVKELVIDAA